MKPIYALSIKQPWAWLVCKGFKDIENRDWYKHMPPLLSWPGYAKNVPMRIYVHAGISKSEFNECTLEWIKKQLLPEQHGQMRGYSWSQLCDFGAIIGEVTITGCVDRSDSKWFVGKYGFVLADPALYERPIPCRGMQKFFKPVIPERMI